MTCSDIQCLHCGRWISGTFSYCPYCGSYQLATEWVAEWGSGWGTYGDDTTYSPEPKPITKTQRLRLRTLSEGVEERG